MSPKASTRMVPRRATRRRAPAQGAPRPRQRLEEAAAAHDSQHYLLRLYVTGTTPASVRAVERVRSACEEHLQGRYELEVYDIYQMPALARDHEIIATPTLIRVLPTPSRRFIGDLSEVEKVLFGPDLRERA